MKTVSKISCVGLQPKTIRKFLQQEDLYILLRGCTTTKEFVSMREEIRHMPSKSRCDDVDQWFADYYFQPLASLMGIPALWEEAIPNILLKGGDGRASARHAARCPSGLPIAVYDGMHWRSRRAHDEGVLFDPYDEYQIYGTNQFCQTYAMMHLKEVLPSKCAGEFTKYYDYTKAALEFIKRIIKDNQAFINSKEFKGHLLNLPEISLVLDIRKIDFAKQLIACVDVCLTEPNICLNIIDVPTN